MSEITLIALACGYVGALIFALAIVGANGRDLDE